MYIKQLFAYEEDILIFSHIAKTDLAISCMFGSKDSLVKISTALKHMQ